MPVVFWGQKCVISTTDVATNDMLNIKFKKY